jgi:hypothetical protein
MKLGPSEQPNDEDCSGIARLAEYKNQSPSVACAREVESLMDSTAHSIYARRIYDLQVGHT